MKKIENATVNSTPRPLPKFIITLELMISRGDIGLNQLEAFSLSGETCLHSTVSTLANNHNIGFSRTREPHKHRNGGKVYFMRYRLNSMENAYTLIEHYMRGGK
jgi:hypothetical protein